MALVKCEIRAGADSIESSTISSFFVPEPVTRSAVLKMFPFEGEFHFRVKVSGKSVGISSTEWLWMDLTEDSQELPASFEIGADGRDSKVVHIQALVLNIASMNLPVNGAGIGLDYVAARADAEYLEQLGSHLRLRNEDRLPRLEISEVGLGQSDGSSSGSMLSDVAEAAGKLLQKGSSTLSSFSESVGSMNLDKRAGKLWSNVTSILGFAGGSTLSDEAEQSLSALSICMEEPVDDVLLQALWSALSLDSHSAASGQFGGYERATIRWKVMGWQKSDPVLDLKNTGSLALRCMLHLSRRYPAKSQDMLARNVANSKSKYPFAIVGVNMTLLLAEVVQLKERAYLVSSNAPYWGLFEDPIAFYELFSICFIFMDALWTKTNAVRADFGKLTAHVKSMVTKILNRGPKNMQDFKILAGEEGMM